MQIQINNNILCDKYKKMVKNIEKITKIKVIYISYPEHILLINNETYKSTSFIKIIKYIITNLTSNIDKMNFLKNICLNIPVIVFSCGPSSNIDLRYISNIQDNYLIMSIKYISTKLINANIKPDFTVTSEFCSNLQSQNLININEEDTVSLHIFRRTQTNYKKDLYFTGWWNKFSHTQFLTSICEERNFVNILYTKNKIKDTHTLFYTGHIMLEIAIPFSLHIGCKNIYTLGWDGPKNNKYIYFNNKEQNVYDNNTYQEYIYIPKISNVLKQNNITVYKCNKNSPIMLEYYDYKLL